MRAHAKTPLAGSDTDRRFDRRRFLGLTAAAGTLALWPGIGGAAGGYASEASRLTRPIPRTGERIPAIGMGTWITFNVGPSQTLRDQRTEVLRRFFAHGGGMIDSSPMYGSAESVLGYGFERLATTEGLFSATKVWTGSDAEGREQVADSFRLWGVPQFDLFQVHNLVNWEAHLPMLAERKAAGRIRYLGLTTSHGSRHDEMLDLMRRDDIDFVQFTYNIADRWAEERLLPMAADRGIAVIVNRPFRRGALPERLRGEPLPGWAADYGIENWPQFLLKFIISHPAVTCAIPATSQVAHMEENMRALKGPLPEPSMRRRMVDYVENL